MSSTIVLDIATPGWVLPGWEREFYPEDLPADWRLTYFANEFSAVMVDAGSCLRTDQSMLIAWAEDTPDGFRFYLEDPGSAAGCWDLDLARRVLGGKLAGVVQGAGVFGSQIPDGVSRFQLRAAPDGVPDASCLPAWRIPPACVRDLRAGRAWLESRVEQAPSGRGLVLLADGNVAVEDLRRWWHLVSLLGLA